MPSKQSPFPTMHFCFRPQMCWKYSWKEFCESLFSSSVAFLIMSVTPQNPPSPQRLFQSSEQAIISWIKVTKEWGMFHCCHILSAKKSLTKSYCYAYVLPWRRNQILVLNFSVHFLLPASQRRRRMSMYISFPQEAIRVNYTRDFL
jgi:hypothetical protein